MLLEQDLAVIRAALQFWDEEMGQCSAETVRGYFATAEDIPGRLGVGNLRTALKDSVLRFAVVDAAGSQFADVRLFPTVAEAEQYRSAVDGQLATVLLQQAEA